MRFTFARDYLDGAKDEEMARLLIGIFETADDHIMKGAAYEALLSYAGMPVQKDWSTVGHEYTESDYRYELIEQIKRQLLNPKIHGFARRL